MPARIVDDIALPEQSAQQKQSTTVQEEIVISGISGRLPESDNVEEFKQHLLAGDDMVTEDGRRWEPGLFGLPRRNGKLKDLTKFDAAFFGVHPKQAHCMDPQLRLLLEVVYEAIADAGVNPASVKGSRTGVFIGTSTSEAWDVMSRDPEKMVGYEMTGCTRSMFANRISFFFDFKGPSFAIDTACSSSLLALDQALESIRAGKCDAAIVGGASVILNPLSSLQFLKLGMMSPEGACKSFDSSGNGYCRSEAVVAVYLQKEDISKRVYATLVHAKNNSDGNKEQGITFPSGEVQKQLLLEVYKETGVDPAQVAYVEAHGTGTKVGDPQELNSITEVFCHTGRQTPLLIGSTKSNMGHPEPASGLAALAKVLISMEEGIIPSNLHFKEPNADIPGLHDGRLQVVAQNTPWSGGYASINSFGFGGSNVHALLKSHSQMATQSHPASHAQRLLTLSARTAEGLERALMAAQEHGDSVEMQTLLQECANTSPATHPYRGYTILNSQNKPKEVQKCSSDASPPVWFVFAGMGSQWQGMGRKLMCIEPFKQSILRSDAVLQQYGIHLYDMLMTCDEQTFDDTLNSFIGIAAIQIAQVDVLKTFGIEPDGIVGHSIGELGCAYADGGLTAEEMMLAAYWRGRCVQETNLPPGAMAAVGLTWEEAKQRCPEGVVPACHNSIDTVTISGPAEAVDEFVKELAAEGTFARVVKSSGVAFHSRDMMQAAPALKAALDKVIKEPRPRTSRWVSTSIPQERWSTPLAQTSSAEYHVNNLISPVLFQEALQHIPSGATCIEIAPHCLLQAILKRSLSTQCTFVGLMKRNHENNAEFLLSSLGKCYMAGLNFNPLQIYPSVTYPVPRGTPMVAPLITWDHAQTWDVPAGTQFTAGAGGNNAGCSYEIDASPESADHYMVGHAIDGRVLYPATGYLVLAWRTLAKLHGSMYEQMPVAFQDVHIHRATILPKTGTVTLDVTLMPGSGGFEVCENGALVVSGKIYVPDQPVLQLPISENAVTPGDNGNNQLSAGDIYKELRLRGYDYGPTFQGILSASSQGKDGYLAWRDNWVSYLDAMLQLQVLSLPGRSLRLPTRIKSIRIDPTAHTDSIVQIDSQHKAVKVIVDRELDTCVAGGAEILGLHATVAPRRQQQQAPPVLEAFHFIPYMQDDLCATAENKQLISDTLSFLQHKLSAILDNGHASQLNNKELFKSVMSSLSQGSALSHSSTLEEVFSHIDDEMCLNHAADVIATHRAELRQELLLDVLLQEPTLKPCLDIAWENSLTNRLKVVQVGAEGSELCTRVLQQLGTQPMLQVDYTVTGPGLETLDPDQVDAYDVKTVPWSIHEAPPSQLQSADVVIMSNVLHKQEDLDATLKTIHTMLKPTGFLLLHEPTSNFTIPLIMDGLTQELPEHKGHTFGPYNNEAEWEKTLNKGDFEVVARKSDGLLSTLFLCNKCRGKDLEPTLISVDDLGFGWVDEVRTAMLDDQNKPEGARIWLLANSLPHNGIVGMTNCLRQEPGGDRIRCIFNASLCNSNTFPSISSSSPVFLQLVERDLAMNVFRDNTWGGFRHLPLTKGKDATVETDCAYVNVLTRGDLASLRWIQSPLRYFSPEDHPSKELCSVYYTSLNFRDVMLATGKLPPDAIPGDMASQDCILGMEFSGRDQAGKRIMGLLPAKGLATKVDASREFLWPVPDTWTLEEAASVPVVYTTAYYALVVRGQIRPGNRVLIHSGSGGVGQAAIAIALHHGCQVFTTVGSKEKREYLKQRFPQLTDQNFSNSRDTTFEWDILRATRGRGVDVVLNSLAEEKLEASLRLLAPHGRFLEIGKFDLSNDTPLGMSIFLKNISFHGILLDALFEDGNADWKVVSDLLTQGIHQGAVKPLNTSVFEKDDIEGAFRFMAQGKHIGKVLVKVRDEEAAKVTPATPVQLAAIPRSTCHPHKSYIITGGLGGFGLELAHWLVERGASKLVLTSRRGVTSNYQARCIQQWREAGVSVLASTHNVRSEAETEQLIKEAQAMGPVGGIFHLAMVLRDGFMENQTSDLFRQVAESKVVGTVNLDEVTRQHCADTLDWFVVYSSVSCGRGNAGQANYGFANSTMERVCEQRKHDGLPGLAIQWGAIGDVGVVLDTMGGNDTVIGGTLPQRITSCLAALDRFLNQSHPVVASTVLAEKKRKSKDQTDKPDLVQSIANILGIKDAANTNADTTLADLGLDSLMGVEVKQTLERDYDVVLQTKEVRLLTINKLRELAAGNTSSQPTTSAANQSTVSESQDTSVVSSSADRSMNDSGLSMRYDTQQLMPQEELVLMKQGEGDCPVFVVHPIEGVVLPLENLASRVKSSVYGLQCTTSAPLTSIPDLAEHYIQKIQEKQSSGPYHLIGYSFGACVAFQMALALEHDGSTVASLFLLDGSISYVAGYTERYKAKMTPGDRAQEDTAGLATFIMQFDNLEYGKFTAEMLALPDYASRLDHTVAHLLSTPHFTANSKDDLTQAADSFYQKLRAADQYKPDQQLASTPVTLVRASVNKEQVERLGEDYGLTKPNSDGYQPLVSQSQLTVHVVDGDHDSFIQGTSAANVANIINTRLAQV